uniref:AlNc14C255G9719 protein n=1 Tax=Albugo laibachii Nc14 TaxID=890382 RepID=F0WTP3_9STRA|nr:AlNc14C255G9719 [Albugo laibachii Nc14]|eukprot:CCA24735.1 AlNc14C255G9719 [Albugo laibachii Nc14]
MLYKHYSSLSSKPYPADTKLKGKQSLFLSSGNVCVLVFDSKKIRINQLKEALLLLIRVILLPFLSAKMLSCKDRYP